MPNNDPPQSPNKVRLDDRTIKTLQEINISLLSIHLTNQVHNQILKTIHWSFITSWTTTATILYALYG